MGKAYLRMGKIQWKLKQQQLNKQKKEKNKNEQQTHEGHGGTSLVCGQIILGIDVLRRKLAPILAGELKELEDYDHH